MDVKTIVPELCAYNDEQEWFEFKVNWFEPVALGEYISALSNAAAYHQRKRELYSCDHSIYAYTRTAGWE